MKYIDGETGLPLEAAEKIKQRLKGLEEKTEIISPTESGLSVGTADNPTAEIVTFNVTIVSSRASKTDIRELTPEELDIQLPAPKAYRLKSGRELIGFIEDELPQSLRHPGGYSLNTLAAILAYKVARLEKRLAELERAEAGFKG